MDRQEQRERAQERLSEQAAPGRMQTGLRTAVVNNATAFGYSIMITGSFGIVTAGEGNATIGQVYLFGMLAVAGFVVLEAVASQLFRRRPETFPVEVTVLATALDFAAVAIGFGGAAAATALFDGTVAWCVAGVWASALFTLAEALVMTVVAPFEQRWVTRGRENSPDR